MPKHLAIITTAIALSLATAPIAHAEGGDDPIPGIDVILKPKGSKRVKLTPDQAEKAGHLKGKARDEYLLKLGIAAVKAGCCGKPDFNDIHIQVKACCGLTGGGAGKVSFPREDRD